MKSCGTAASPRLTSEGEQCLILSWLWPKVWASSPAHCFFSILKKRLDFFSPLPPDSAPGFVCPAIGATEWLLTHAAPSAELQIHPKKTAVKMLFVFYSLLWCFSALCLVVNQQNYLLLSAKSFFLPCFHTLPVGKSFWQRSAQLRLNWAMGREEAEERAEHNLETMWTHFSIFSTHWSLSCLPSW